jgi:hypothetical protein
MALIRTAIEAKAALPRVLSNLGATANLPDFAAAEIKYLVPLIGFAQYNAINDKINATPTPEALTDAETVLLPYLRRVVAFFAYLDDMGTDNAKITDNGLRTTESANLPRVFGWQYKELKETLQSKAYDAVEVMLRFLFENKADYSDWTGSEEYASLNALLIKTGTDFDAHYKLYQPMRTFYSLKVLLDEVQEDFIKPAIGEDLLTYFIELDAPDDDEKKFIKLLKKAAAYLVIKKACQHYSVRFDSNGFTILSGDSENPQSAGRTQADTTLFEMKMNSCESDAQTYLAKAKKALATFRVDSANTDFNDAYDDGPLVNYDLTVTKKDRGNDTRKIFRF